MNEMRSAKEYQALYAKLDEIRVIAEGLQGLTAPKALKEYEFIYDGEPVWWSPKNRWWESKDYWFHEVMDLLDCIERNQPIRRNADKP